MAVVALVLAFVAPLVGLVLGIVALVRTTARPGRGLAVAATAVSAVGTLMLPVLASVAIPVFLSQRAAAWDAMVTSELRDASVHVEAGLVETGGPASLDGFQPRPDVVVDLLATQEQVYCLAATHAGSGTTLYLDSTLSGVSEQPCA